MVLIHVIGGARSQCPWGQFSRGFCHAASGANSVDSPAPNLSRACLLGLRPAILKGLALDRDEPSSCQQVDERHDASRVEHGYADRRDRSGFATDAADQSGHVTYRRDGQPPKEAVVRS